MPQYNYPGLDPSLQFQGPEESSWATDSSSQFGSSRYSHPSLATGLNPLFMQDPRFDYRAGFNGPADDQLRIFRGSQPRGIGINLKNAPHFTADLDDKTVAGDMWAVTLGRHTGTSPGDEANPVFVNLAKSIVGDGQQITPDHVKQMRQALLGMRQADFRQQHEGPAWLPQTPHQERDR